MNRQNKKLIFRRLISSYLSSVISISLVLVLVGFLGIISVNTKMLTDYLKENIKLSVIMNDDATSEDAGRLLRDVEKGRYVKKAELITKEQGAKEMKELLGNDFLEVFENNPIPYSIDVYLKADYFAADSISFIRSDISRKEGVRELVYQESLVDAINGNVRKAGIIFSAVIILLAFVSLVLINNTVRLNIFAKKESIRTMIMVGAKRSYIRGPFMTKAFYQGMVSGLVADAALGGLLYYVNNEFGELFSIVSPVYIYAVLLAVLLLGIIICLASTWNVINRLIAAPADELYY
jgi:cell division transport system permease protein